MARKVITTLVDDINGEPIEEGQGETVPFALDGANYERSTTTSRRAAASAVQRPGRAVRAARRVRRPRRTSAPHASGCARTVTRSPSAAASPRPYSRSTAPTAKTSSTHERADPARGRLSHRCWELQAAAAARVAADRRSGRKTPLRILEMAEQD
jgi:hypothetical protein